VRPDARGAIVSIHVIMSNTEHPGGAAHRSFRCTFGPVREVDLVWPPPDAEIDAFSIVHLDDGDAQPPRVEAPPIEPPPAEPVRLEVVARAPRRIKPTFGDCRALGAAPRVRPLVVPMEPAPVHGPAVPDPPVVGLPPAIPDEARVAEMPAGDITIATAKAPPLLPIHLATLPSDPETAGASRSAWLAVFFAAACVLVTIAEYRGVAWRSGAREAPPVPADVTVADVQAPQVDPVRSPAAPRPATAERAAAASPPRPIPAPTPKLARAPEPTTPVAAPASGPRLPVATPRREVEPTRPAASNVTVAVRDRGMVTAADKVEPPPPALPLSPEPVAAAAARPEPLAKTAPAPSTPVAAMLTDTASDEDDIRSTLTRFRTAYSQLNASAARDVWPSVDARALERAFQSLKSQDLRFDSCKMTVTGARAQAACKGRAVYVPRIGDQSPRFTAREWNFELRKADERWTIASARSL
jgi:hypothetical protein